MRVKTSKPSSDAGFRPIADFLPGVLAGILMASQRPAAMLPRQRAVGALGPFRSPLRREARSGGGLSLLAEQSTQARQSACLTGRHKAPTGAPASTQVRVGDEGTPSRAVVAYLAGVPTKPAIDRSRRPVGRQGT